MKKYLIGSCAYNEGEKIKRVINKYNDYVLYDVLIIDDGSTDGALKSVPSGIPVIVIRNEKTQGAGHCIRQLFSYAREKGYTAIFFASGNDKDDPQDIVKFKQAIEEGFDLIQGSRYLKGGV